MSQEKQLPLRLTYDTERNPLSFDFVYCLAICRALCDMNKLPPKFDVVLVSQGFRDVGVETEYSNEYRERKLRDVLISTATICKWVNSVNIIRGDTELPSYTGPTIPTPRALEHIGKLKNWQVTPMVGKQLEDIFKMGGRIPDPGFQASEEILQRYRPILSNAVVFHPRVSLHNPKRNTDKSTMQYVARLLRSQGRDVFFVPDVEDIRAGFSWSDFEAEPLMEAAYDIEARVGVAECAASNLIFSGGGNASMLNFSRARFLWTGFFDDSSRVTSRAFFSEKGPTMGKNPPWLDPASQVWDWTPRAEVTPKYMVERLLELDCSLSPVLP